MILGAPTFGPPWRTYPDGVPVRIKRVYDSPAAEDGRRVLVDRVWPRGLSKEKARVDEWAKDLAPSTELRRWFGHDDEKFAEFERRYRAELEAQRPKLEALAAEARDADLTLVYAARNERSNQAVVLARMLDETGS